MNKYLYIFCMLLLPSLQQNLKCNHFTFVIFVTDIPTSVVHIIYYLDNLFHLFILS